MVNIDHCSIYLANTDQTAHAGAIFARSLLQHPVTIALHGEMGAGKTTFIQGLAKALGITDHVTSPTYALEQRYKGTDASLLHLDLYRLNPTAARSILSATDDAEGIRCVEWAGKLEDELWKDHHAWIEITLAEERTGRRLRCDFADVPLPSQEMITTWRTHAMLPQHVIDHCEAVASLCDVLAQRVQQDGLPVRPHALHIAAQVHDLFRFLDFRPGAAPSTYQDDAASTACWEQWSKRYPDTKHEPACALFLQEQGFHALGAIVAPHGLAAPPSARGTLEQQLLYYADKRVQGDRVVTLDERFADFAVRYGKGHSSPDHTRWKNEVQTLEKDLFADRIPSL